MRATGSHNEQGTVSKGRSDAMFKRALSLTPGGVHSPVRAFQHVGSTPLFMESANGARIRDADGHSYTDFCMGFGPLILGHRHPVVEQAALEALKDGWCFGTAERYSLELAELIGDHIPAAENIRFVNSGTEAVIAAIRLARAATGRTKILKFSGCYHGHADSMLVDAGSGMAGIAASAGVPDGVVNDTLVAPLDDTETLLRIFADSNHQIAAAIIEPLPANHGLLPQTQEFLQLLATLCGDNGSLLIFDEVITGFRLGLGGCAEKLGIKPDLFTWGKIIGGGFPVGAYAGKQSIMQQVAPSGDVYQAGTLSANPLAMRAGKATLKKIIDGGVYEKLDSLGQRLEAGIAQVDGLQIVREGSLFWLCRERGNKQPARNTEQYGETALDDFPRVFRHLLHEGIYTAPSPYEVGFLSTAHTEDDIDSLVDACDTYFENRKS